MTLNPEQKKAVETVKGRVLVLAGAGTGKTRVLTLRISHLLDQHNVLPEQILGLTFTNKAASEMRHRIGNLIGPKRAAKIALCTFHSFCIQVLREEIVLLGYTPNFTIYREADVQRVISHIARDILENENELPSLANTLAAITFAKNRGLKSTEIKDTGSTWHDGFASNVYERLQNSMRAYNAVDFDDLIILTVKLFEEHPEVLNAYQDRFRYIMIDEYQDTNPIQYKLASLLSNKYNNLCVVGDDDQSIYGWRGAEVKNILDFQGAVKIKLEQNYRSTNNILKAANAVIDKNQARHKKTLWSEKGEGKLIEFFVAPTSEDEAEAVVYRILQIKQQRQLRWSDFAILYRSNALSRSFETALLRHSRYENGVLVKGIPYQIFGGVEFYERREIKDLAAYLRLIVNKKDQEGLLRIINQPRRGIGDSALSALTTYNRQKNLSLWEVIKAVSDGNIEDDELFLSLPAKAIKGLKEFVDLIETSEKHFASQPLGESFAWLIDKINYKKAIEEEVKSAQMRQFKWENVEEFVNSMVDYETKLQNLGQKPELKNFLTTVSLENDWDQARKSKETDDKVQLMTFHSAKGLEFPVCFLVGVEDHIIPHEKSLKETGIEEERRLMYVAITRAMNQLVVSSAYKRLKNGKEIKTTPSRFLFDIPKELLHVTNWDGSTCS